MFGLLISESESTRWDVWSRSICRVK